MQVLVPQPISDATLYSSSAPEDDHAAWASGTTYAAGTRVIRTAGVHRIFERLLAGAGTTPPEDDATNWVDAGPTNRWAMLDDSPSSATSLASPLTVYLTPDAVNDVVLMGVIGTEVRIYSGATGATLVRTVAVPSPVAPATTRTVVITGLGIAAGNRVGVQISGTGTVQCAHLALGTFAQLGTALVGCEVGITDYSVIETDDYGAQTVTVRPYSRWISGTYVVTEADTDAVVARVESLLSRVCWWQVDSAYDALQTLGWPRTHQLVYRGAGYALINFRLEGLSRDDALVQAGAVVPAASGLADVLATPARLDLSQYACAIAAAADGTVASWAAATTTCRALVGTRDDTAAWTLGKADTGCTSTLVDGVVQITGMTADAAYVDISATRSGYAPMTARFSVARVAAGAAATPNLLRGAQAGPHSVGPGTYGTRVAVLKDGSDNPFGLTPGEPLTLSADLWQDAAALAAGQNATVYLVCADSGGTWSTSAAVSGAGLSASRSAATVVLPAAASMYLVAVDIYHQGGPPPNTTGSAYADRVQVQRGTVATPYMPGVSDGADGATSYLHVMYSDDGGATFTGAGGKAPGAWIGTYTDFYATDSTDPADYTWARLHAPDYDQESTPSGAPQGSTWRVPSTGRTYKLIGGTWHPYVGPASVGTTELAAEAATKTMSVVVTSSTDTLATGVYTGALTRTTDHAVLGYTNSTGAGVVAQFEINGAASATLPGSYPGDLAWSQTISAKVNGASVRAPYIPATGMLYLWQIPLAAGDVLDIRLQSTWQLPTGGNVTAPAGVLSYTGTEARLTIIKK